MDIPGWVLLIGGSAVLGIAVREIRHVPHAPHRGMVAFVAAFLGAVVASEWLFATSEPIWAGVALWPALVCGLVVAILVDALSTLPFEGSRPSGEEHGKPAA